MYSLTRSKFWTAPKCLDRGHLHTRQSGTYYSGCCQFSGASFTMNSGGMRILIQLLATEALRGNFHGKFHRKWPVKYYARSDGAHSLLLKLGSWHPKCNFLGHSGRRNLFAWYRVVSIFSSSILSGSRKKFSDIGILSEMSKVNTLHRNLSEFVGNEKTCSRRFAHVLPSVCCWAK